MENMIAKRAIVKARSTLGQTVAGSFLPLERSADETALAALKCVATLLEQRIAAGLPVTAGHEAIDLIQQGCTQAFAAQASFRQAHAMFTVLADEFGVPFYAPECPPNGSLSEETRRAA